jgi:hypothetical protein
MFPIISLVYVIADCSLSDDRVAELLLLADELLADVARGVYECTRYSLPKDKTHD